MPDASSLEDQDSDLPPAGSRSGSGAQSVLPYLTKTLKAKPASSDDAREATRPSGRNPVFSDWPPRPRN